MLDRERVLVRLDQLDGYLRELREVVPADFAAYRRTKIKRLAKGCNAPSKVNDF